MQIAASPTTRFAHLLTQKDIENRLPQTLRQMGDQLDTLSLETQSHKDRAQIESANRYVTQMLTGIPKNLEADRNRTLAWMNHHLRAAQHVPGVPKPLDA